MIPAQKVIELCENYLRKQHEGVLRLQEPSIQKAMKGGWFRKPKTREEATKHLYDHSSLWGEYHLARLTGLWGVSEAKALLTLAKLKGEGEVAVSADIADIIC